MGAWTSPAARATRGEHRRRITAAASPRLSLALGVSSSQAEEPCDGPVKWQQLPRAICLAHQRVERERPPLCALFTIPHDFNASPKAATLQIDGTLLWSDDTKAWPTEVKHNQTTKMPITAISIESTVGFTITSSGTGLLNGNGAAWWGLPGIGYLERG